MDENILKKYKLQYFVLIYGRIEDWGLDNLGLKFCQIDIKQT